MSGHDRGRDYRNRKKYSTSRQQDREEKPFKRPVILTKSKDGESSQSKVQETQIQPTMILKTREGENRAISPNLQSSVAKSKKDADAAPSYQLAPKAIPAENTGLIFSPPTMKNSVKLLDDVTMQICDGLVEFLTDQTDFLVIGCLGLQSVGKSTVMSHLASLPVTVPYTPIFKTQTPDQEDTGSHCTEGIDAYITSDRVILLDCQPILSLSILAKSMSCENPRSTSREEPEIPVLENDMEIQSLQYAAFILSVCHVVLFIQDWAFDTDLLRFLQAAEMLKPPTSTPTEDEELVEYFPHVMMLHTKATSSYFLRQQIQDIQEAYRCIFTTSNLQLQSGMGIANGNILKTLTPALCGGDPLNIFFLPPFNSNDDGLAVEVMDYVDLFRKLRQQLYGVVPTPLSSAILTEKNWWHYAVKIWEGIKKSSYFPEFSRHMPTAASVYADLNAL